ncbi:hypothetical protein D4764_08G0011820 [Takifugu flavidus]|uniref:Reverse transcriptase domain-containing protein n=1 Tax=Takifugu flavidus TaxID=433684 RepID=A0A5C6MQX8_9TELE|nr:hypothetical protein D4764_08G0011820 [Takifugu flavidus]
MILDHLTKGSQSDRLLCSTGVPQGTVLAPLLFTLNTTDSHSSSSCHLQNFSEDSAAVGLITDGDDMEYRELIQDLVDWSLRNNLQINAGKTKELVSSKYLGVHLNKNLDWTHGQQQTVPAQEAEVFGSAGTCPEDFMTLVGSAIFYGLVCWSSSITDRDRKRMDRLVRRASSVLGRPLDRDRRRMDRLVRRASSVLGRPLDSVEVVGNGRMMAQLSSMLNNTSPPYRTP